MKKIIFIYLFLYICISLYADDITSGHKYSFKFRASYDNLLEYKRLSHIFSSYVGLEFTFNRTFKGSKKKYCTGIMFSKDIDGYTEGSYIYVLTSASCLHEGGLLKVGPARVTFYSISSYYQNYINSILKTGQFHYRLENFNVDASQAVTVLASKLNYSVIKKSEDFFDSLFLKNNPAFRYDKLAVIVVHKSDFSGKNIAYLNKNNWLNKESKALINKFNVVNISQNRNSIQSSSSFGDFIVLFATNVPNIEQVMRLEYKVLPKDSVYAYGSDVIPVTGNGNIDYSKITDFNVRINDTDNFNKALFHDSWIGSPLLYCVFNIKDIFFNTSQDERLDQNNPMLRVFKEFNQYEKNNPVDEGIDPNFEIYHFNKDIECYVYGILTGITKQKLIYYNTRKQRVEKFISSFDFVNVIPLSDSTIFNTFNDSLYKHVMKNLPSEDITQEQEIGSTLSASINADHRDYGTTQHSARVSAEPNEPFLTTTQSRSHTPRSNNPVRQSVASDQRGANPTNNLADRIFQDPETAVVRPNTGITPAPVAPNTGTTPAPVATNTGTTPASVSPKTGRTTTPVAPKTRRTTAPVAINTGRTTDPETTLTESTSVPTTNSLQRNRSSVGQVSSSLPKTNRKRQVATPQVATPQGVEPQGVEPQGVEPQGATPQGATPQGVEPQGVEPQGVEPQGVEPQGATPQGVEPQGVEPQGVDPQGATPQGATPQGATPQGAAKRRMSQSARSDDSLEDFVDIFK